MREKGTRLLALFLVLSMALSLTACGGGDGGAADSAVETGTHSGPDDLSPPQEDSSNAGSEEKPPANGPKILRHVEYYVGGGNEVLSAYAEYTYDEQGNCAEYEEYQRNEDEWVHSKHIEFDYDSQGRIQEKRVHSFSDSGDVEDTMTQIESAPDHVALNFGNSGSREIYYYNDLGQCVRIEFTGGGEQIYWYKTYTYDGEGKITEANQYFPSTETAGESEPYSRYVYEYEGDAVSLLDIIQPAEPQPAESQPSQDGGTPAALAGYAGVFTPYEAFSGSYGGGSKFKDVTLDAQGVVTGGGTDWYSINCHGQQPASVTQNEDGSIVLSYSEFEKYTIYPVGVIPEMYTSYLGNDLDRNAVHLEYFLTDGGVMNILYHADPASLGTTPP